MAKRKKKHIEFLDDVYLVSGNLNTVTKREITALEKRLKFPLPSGYREYMTQLGRGSYCGELCVYDPEFILENYESSREIHVEQFDEYYWDVEGDVLESSDIRDSVQFAYTYNGDELIACPNHPGKIFRLPRHDSWIVILEKEFFDPDACAWPDGHKTPFRYFESSGSHRGWKEFGLKTSMNAEEIVEIFETHWNSGEFRRIDLDVKPGRCMHLFMKEIGGWAQVCDSPVHIMLHYDKTHGRRVGGFMRKLKRLAAGAGCH